MEYSGDRILRTRQPEMRERVDRLVGFGSRGIWVSTFHSMCENLGRHISLWNYRFYDHDADDREDVDEDVCKASSD